MDVLALGKATDPELALLAQKTGGKLYYASADVPSPDFMVAMTDSVSNHAASKDQPVSVVSRAINFTNTEVVETVYLDPDLGRQTVFTVTYNKAAKFQINVISPSNAIFFGVANNKVNMIEIAIGNQAEVTERLFMATFFYEMTFLAARQLDSENPATQFQVIVHGCRRQLHTVVLARHIETEIEERNDGVCDDGGSLLGHVHH